MRIFLFSLLAICLPFMASAQLDNLLKDPNVTWAATFETEHDFRLNVKRVTSQFQLKKFTYPESGCVDFVNDNWLAYWVLDEMKAGRYKLYDDPNLSIIVTHTNLMNKITTIDTVITFDPNSYEERLQVIQNDINADDIVAFRTHQAIFYDKKSGSFSTRLLAVAPMIKKTDNMGNVVSTAPLAWLAMDGGAAGNLDLQNPDITWSALLIDQANGLEISKLKIKKDEQKKNFAEQLYQETFGMKHPVEETTGYGCGKLLTKKDLESMFTAIDPVITFDPATYKETMQVVRNELKAEDIKSVALVQEWYFDNRRKMLANRLKAVGPLVSVTDERGNFIYTKVLYYLHF